MMHQARRDSGVAAFPIGFKGRNLATAVAVRHTARDSSTASAPPTRPQSRMQWPPLSSLSSRQRPGPSEARFRSCVAFAELEPGVPLEGRSL